MMNALCPIRITLLLLATLVAHSASPLDQKWTTPAKKGNKVPSVTFQTRTRIEVDDPETTNPFDWKAVTTDDLFQNKRVVVFALPGAFTPTCSSTHLPEYEDAFDTIQSLGIDDVYCISVNDAFVMRQWGLHQGLEEDKTIGSLGFQKVKLIPDGAAAFTRGMGMSCLWDTERGFGERSWRYSMVVNNGVIEEMFVEGGNVTQNSEADPFDVSNAETMVEYLKKSQQDNEL